MKNITSNKATVCVNKTCATVYGQTADWINTIVLFVTVVAAISVIAKAIR